MALICTTSLPPCRRSLRLSILARRLRVASTSITTIVQLLGIFGGFGIVPIVASVLLLVLRVQFAGLLLGVAISNLFVGVGHAC